MICTFFPHFDLNWVFRRFVNWVDVDADPIRFPSSIHKNAVFDAQIQWQQVNNTRANSRNGHERLIVQLYVNEPELVLSKHLF